MLFLARILYKLLFLSATIHAAGIQSQICASLNYSCCNHLCNDSKASALVTAVACGGLLQSVIMLWKCIV